MVSILVMPALGMQRQLKECHKFKASFVCNSKFQGRQSYILRSYLKHLNSTPSVNFKVCFILL